jgi:hypothetical protein
LNLNTDKEILRRYLLGTLEAEAQADIEERILSDPATYEELSLLEEELIDQYVANGLSKTEQRLFETNFLITEERQKNLHFGQLLKRYLSSQAVSARAQKAPVQKVNRRRSAKRLLAPLASAVIAVAVLGIGLLCWLAVKQLAVQQNASRVVVVPLTPGTDGSPGDATKRLTVPPHGFNVKLELEVVTNTSFKNYKSELFRENKPVQTDALRMETKGAQRIVPLTIKGQTLSPGEYQVKLIGVSESGQDEFIDNYTFRVTK